MAEALANQLFGTEMQASSAGVVAQHGVGAANPHGVAVMAADYGIDTSGHVPTSAETLSPTDYDTIIALDPTVTQRLQQNLGWRDVAIITWNIADPFGSDLANYRKTAQQIEAQLKIMFPRTTLVQFEL